MNSKKLRRTALFKCFKHILCLEKSKYFSNILCKTSIGIDKTKRIAIPQLPTIAKRLPKW